MAHKTICIGFTQKRKQTKATFPTSLRHQYGTHVLVLTNPKK